MVQEEPTAYLARLPDGPIVVLRDTALTIWREAVNRTGQGSVAERVASTYGVSPDDVEADVEACIADLVENGVLERADK
jgi:hypothetical protein